MLTYYTLGLPGSPEIPGLPNGPCRPVKIKQEF